MKTFEWSPVFETGLEEVDTQHRRLVELVNDLGDKLESGEAQHIDATLNALAQYTVYHFGCEEALMRSAGVDPEYAQRHEATHRLFVKQVTDWISQRNAPGQTTLPQLLDYLANWLIFHILGDDQSMGRQVAAIRKGQDAHQAFTGDRVSDDPRTVILLGGLRRLYSDLLERNEKLLTAKQSLIALNENLETRVQERTAALLAANERIRLEQERLIETEKMASLGRMVAGFAHEVNTPVGVAVGAVSQVSDVISDFHNLLAREEVTEQELEQQLRYMKDGNDLALANLRRAAELVQSFKRTAVDQTSEQHREFLLSELLSDVVYSLRPLFKHSQVEVTVQCPKNLRMSGLPGVMSQVFTNLLINAHAHAFDDGKNSGHVYIAAQENAGQVQLTVRDDGHGMSEDTLQKAFEPFYTTRRHSGGSGLGLYIVYSLITHKLGGSITCESSPGAGSSFRICMPYQTTQMAEAQT